MTTIQLKLSGMHCVSCSLLIEGELEDIGVQAKANYAKQLVDCTYDEEKIDVKKIQEVIEKLGYKVVS
ncbi:MAG: heavy-metal-associated domain-containing protein [Microgenomates group bacterium]